MTNTVEKINKIIEWILYFIIIMLNGYSILDWQWWMILFATLFYGGINATTSYRRGLDDGVKIGGGDYE